MLSTCFFLWCAHFCGGLPQKIDEISCGTRFKLSARFSVTCQILKSENFDPQRVGRELNRIF